MRPILGTLLLFVALASVASAHDAETLDRMPSPHGGRVRMAGRYHIELVLEGKRLRVYFMSHANRLVGPPHGKVTARVTRAGETKSVTLMPTKDGSLGADGDFATADDVEIVIERDAAEPLVVRFEN